MLTPEKIADSTCWCNRWVDPEDDLIRRFHAAASAGTVIMLIHDILDILCRDGSEIPVPGKVLPVQSSGNLTSSLPQRWDGTRSQCVIYCAESAPYRITLAKGNSYAS